MGAMCSPAQYEARFGPVPPDKAGQLQATLEDATALITAELGGWTAGEDEALDAACLAVCRSVAHRAMARQFDGVTQVSQTAESYSAQLTYANPNGDIYLTASDRAILGTDGCVLGFARMGGE